ncbi:hypothetical protein NKR23_g1486 [Pleurostoma richardsiae]|uniref:Uncharacterized protein n=1 Tax=Pleurostoma richardsiae TaxID=41990 RepID=A0AA38RR70_9PEZI|nr:hypothetical protein NKR23_g1486 [Pleurostoma richardsiae]
MGLAAPYTILISLAISMAIEATQEIHSRSKINRFLDDMNAQLFRPKGLICLIMTWRPENPDEITADIDIRGQVLATTTDEDRGMLSKIRRRLRSSAASTSFDWPEMAQLVYLDRDDTTTATAGQNARMKGSLLQRGSKFIDEYIDKRAVARWADPNHPASSGGIVALLTGGHITLDGVAEQGPSGPLSLLESSWKLLNKDVLYLMIVNMPSEEELARAKEWMSSP